MDGDGSGISVCARQVGKTTLLLQSVEQLLTDGVPAANILYATFDHPILKLAGIEKVLDAWRQREPREAGPEFLFLDEAQFLPGWETWIKHQVDFFKQRRIVFTGSAMTLLDSKQESGVGRWHTIRLTTLSFSEYVQIRNLKLPPLPEMSSLAKLFEYSQSGLARIRETASSYVPHFHEYLIRGGFPQTALVESITQAQRLLREDIVDKVLKRDLTALFGVRHVIELERTFLYLCMHNGGVVDFSALSSNLDVSRVTAQRFIELLEATHMIFRLHPFGYGKEVLRGRVKAYLADPAIGPSVMLRGREILEDATALGIATETAVIKHLFTRYYSRQIRFSFWRGKKNEEVDLIAELGDDVIPFEVKYRSSKTGSRELRGLFELCRGRKIDKAYVVTKSVTDLGPWKDAPAGIATKIMFVPATLLCYWTGEPPVTP